MGDLARGLHPPPRRSPLLSFGTVADCLPARLLLSPLLSSPLPSAPLRSSPPLRSSAFDYLREGDGGGGRRREGGTLSDSPGSLEIATLPTVLCIRRAFCNEASNHPLLFLPFPSLRPIDNWRKLYAGVRRVKPMECLPFIVLICSAVSILHGGYGEGIRFTDC